MPPEKKRHQKCLLSKEICLLMWIVMNKKYWSRIREMAAISHRSLSQLEETALCHVQPLCRHHPFRGFLSSFSRWSSAPDRSCYCYGLHVCKETLLRPRTWPLFGLAKGGYPPRLNKWCQELKAKFYHISFGLASLGLYTHHQIPIWITHVSNENSLKYTNIV